MKRSPPPQRRTYLQRNSPIKRTAMKRRAKGKGKRVMGKAASRWESPGYLDYIRTLPCVLTGEPADHAHHLIGTGGMSGMGLKAPDWAAMPVTFEAHARIHNSSELQAMQWEWIARTLGRALEDGALVVGV